MLCSENFFNGKVLSFLPAPIFHYLSLKAGYKPYCNIPTEFTELYLSKTKSIIILLIANLAVFQIRQHNRLGVNYFLNSHPRICTLV